MVDLVVSEFQTAFPGDELIKSSTFLRKKVHPLPDKIANLHTGHRPDTTNSETAGFTSVSDCTNEYSQCTCWSV